MKTIITLEATNDKPMPEYGDMQSVAEAVLSAAYQTIFEILLAEHEPDTEFKVTKVIIEECTRGV